MHEQFLLLTEGQRKEKPELAKAIAGRRLFDNGSSQQVWLDTEKGEVTILTRLTCSPQIDRQLLQAQSQMNVTIGRYRSEIINANNK